MQESSRTGNGRRPWEGTPQRASASPLLANVYLHDVFDLWAQWWRSRYAHGDVITVRFADDFVVGFERQEDAQRFFADLRERFAEIGLGLHPDKTRLIEFGRHAAVRRAGRDLGKSDTVDFLGFAHLVWEAEEGRFWRSSRFEGTLSTIEAPAQHFMLWRRRWAQLG